MSFKATQWEFSDEVDFTQIDPVEGQQYAQIVDARYDEEKGIYTVSLQSMTNNAIFDLNYWMYTRDEGSGKEVRNSKARGTLISLGKALAGENIGIPFPGDIKGAMVSINLSMSKPNVNGVSYPRVYSFAPVPEDIAAMSTVDQYYLPN